MDRYEKFVLRDYAVRALTAPETGWTRYHRPSRGMALWLYENAELLGLDTPRGVDLDRLEPAGFRVDRETWVAFDRLVKGLMEMQAPPPPSGLETRLDWLCHTLSLGDTDAAIVKVALRATLVKPVHTLIECLDQKGMDHDEIKVAAIAFLIGVPARALARKLDSSGHPLRVLGLLEYRFCGDFAPSPTLLKIARLETIDPGRLRAALIGKCVEAELEWSDFDHLGEYRDFVERLLRAALTQKTSGVNILLYGPPGTGKTAFVRTLAKQLKAEALFAGETDEDNEEPARSARIAAVALLRALAGRSGRSLLVVDEADDLFTGVDDSDAGSRVGSKVFMNRLVERAEVPTIWITNRADQLGEAVLRRMALAVPFAEPGRKVRRRVLLQAAARRRIGLSRAAADALAEIAAPPAVMESALRSAQLARGNLARGAGLAARSIMRVMRRGPARAANAGRIEFDAALCAADQDLERLAARVAAQNDLALSFCLHGAPGTGKSAYARHLAHRLGLDVLEKRASDVLSMWVGESEKGIARAFEEAADRGAFLLFDEADSLLFDRAHARRGWEVSQVNEMLTWMERHPYPFACTTNLMTELDPATARRFLFKVAFLPMSAEQAREAFRRAFDIEPPPALDGIEPLAPGDFAVVARKAEVLREADPAALVAMLAEEVAAKPGAGRRRIGF